MNFADTKVTRRTVLRLMTSSALVTVLSGFSSACGPKKPDMKTVAQHLIDVLHHPERAHEIGNLYLQQTPELQEKSFEAITRDILVELDLDHKNITEDHLKELVDKLRQQVREDFVRENVVVIEGFMLSKTEAMLCTLAVTYRS